MLFIFVPDLTKEKTKRYKVKTSNKDILKRIDALENLLKKNPSNANRQTGKPMTFKEVCAYLGYAPSYLYKLTYKNVIPHHKPTGKMLYFFKDEIDEWICSSAQSKAHSAKGEGTSGSTTLTASDPCQVEMFGTSTALSAKCRMKSVPADKCAE